MHCELPEVRSTSCSGFLVCAQRRIATLRERHLLDAETHLMIIRVVRRNQGKGRNSGARRISQVPKKKKKKESISVFARLQKEKYSIPGHGRPWSSTNKELHGRAGGGEGDGRLSRRSGEVSPGHSFLQLNLSFAGGAMAKLMEALRCPRVKTRVCKGEGRRGHLYSGGRSWRAPTGR